MRIVFLVSILAALLSCSTKNNHLLKTSYWENLKDSFTVKNLPAFVVDSALLNSYETFPRIQNKMIDSTIRYGTPYLYSWQENDSSPLAFTVFVNEAEHGDRIIYFILDDKDSLRSATQVSSKGSEGGIVYETRSTFIAKDTLIKIAAATTRWDLTKPAPPPRLSKPKGDSIFSYLTVTKDGRMTEKEFAQKKELHLE